MKRLAVSNPLVQVAPHPVGLHLYFKESYAKMREAHIWVSGEEGAVVMKNWQANFYHLIANQYFSLYRLLRQTGHLPSPSSSSPSSLPPPKSKEFTLWTFDEESPKWIQFPGFVDNTTKRSISEHAGVHTYICFDKILAGTNGDYQSGGHR
mgnify:FL=1